MWHTCNTEPTSMVVPQFCTIGRYQPALHPRCMDWSVNLPPPDIMFVHPFCGKYSVNTLYLYHLISAKHHSLLALREIPSMSSLWWIFWMGGGNQRLFGVSTATPLEQNQESNPHRDSGSVWQSHPKNKVISGVKQQST